MLILDLWMQQIYYLEDNYFDIIIIANALHILPNPRLVLIEMKRCLKENGTIYATNFLKPQTIKEKAVLNITRILGYHVYSEYDEESFINMLTTNGLIVNKTAINECFRTLFFTECSIKRTLKQKV